MEGKMPVCEGGHPLRQGHRLSGSGTCAEGDQMAAPSPVTAPGPVTPVLS